MVLVVVNVLKMHISYFIVHLLQSVDRELRNGTWLQDWKNVQIREKVQTFEYVFLQKRE